MHSKRRCRSGYREEWSDSETKSVAKASLELKSSKQTVPLIIRNVFIYWAENENKNGKFGVKAVRLDGEQNRAHDASIGFGVLPTRAAVDVQSGSEGGFRSRSLLQVDSVQTRRGFGPCQSH